jgi:hypothetical protein
MTSLPLPDPIRPPWWSAVTFERDRLIERALAERPDWYPNKVLARIAEPDSDGNILWTGTKSADGYGTVHLPRSVAKRANGNDIKVKVHRVRYLAERGPIAYGHEPDHLCDVRLCQTIDHLNPTTQAQNTLRSAANPMAQNARQTHCLTGLHELAWLPDGSKRKCPPCRNARDAVRNALRVEVLSLTELTQRQFHAAHGSSLGAFIGSITEHGGDHIAAVAQRVVPARLGLASMADGSYGRLAKRALQRVVEEPLRI